MVLATAWISTKMEHDKTIITLSAGAIGLLVTVLTTKGVADSWHIFLFMAAFSGYITAIIVCLIIFQKNSTIIEDELNEARKDPAIQQKQDHHLKRLDKISLYSFLFATIAFVLIGIFTAMSKPKESEKKKDQPSGKKEAVVQLQSTSAKLHNKAHYRPASKRSGIKKECSTVIINCVQEARYSSCQRTISENPKREENLR